MDQDIWDGKLADFDVLVLPSDRLPMLEGPAKMKEGYMAAMSKNMPPEYRSGLGDKGAAAIREFVEQGGRLLAMEGSSDYAIKVLGLPVRNILDKVSRDEFNDLGSTLRVTVDPKHPMGYGMPAEALILHWNGPVFEVTDRFHANEYPIIVRFQQDNLLKSGYLCGEDKIVGRAACLQAPCGKGEAILYGFAPSKRAQTHGTFKLLFNGLYL